MAQTIKETEREIMLIVSSIESLVKLLPDNQDAQPELILHPKSRKEIS